MDVDKDWKKDFGFPINYHSDEDFDDNDVVIRRSSTSLLEDQGDGAEADLLGTTPPRARIRRKLKKKTYMDAVTGRDIKKMESSSIPQPSSPGSAERIKNYLSRKFQRSVARDMKQDTKADSLPPDSPPPNAVPTFVESCSRFMSLTSRLKCREDPNCDEGEVETRRSTDESRRESFHKTFCLLINMGNMEKGCRRTCGDTKWRSGILTNYNDENPIITFTRVDHINIYEFETKPIGPSRLPDYNSPPGGRSSFLMYSIQKELYVFPLLSFAPWPGFDKISISREEQVWQNELKDLIWLELQARLAGRSLAKQDAFLCAQRDVLPDLVNNIRNYKFVNPNPCMSARCPQQDTISETEDTDHQLGDNYVGCLSLQCNACSVAVGVAMKQVSSLLDSFYAATTLYPSTKALNIDHPTVATNLFQNRLKAMCQWYNVAHYMRLKILTIRRMLRTMELKKQSRAYCHLASSDCDISRQSSENRSSQVRFKTPTDSNNSDSSGQSDNKEQKEERDGNEREGDEVDSGCEKKVDTSESGQMTPEITLPDPRYSTSTSDESGYSTSRESDVTSDDVYDLGSLDDVTKLRLLDKCAESPYRTYHREMLKTQGVRRCMMFMNKMRMSVLHKVQETLVKPDLPAPKPENDAEDHDVFQDAKEEHHREEKHGEDEDVQRRYELMRYGCWSEETLAMGLPSYRNHFLLLSTICMEAVHDYLSLRLEDRPQNPSCLTVKQLIHELKEGLDIATETSSAFGRNIKVALAGQGVDNNAKQELLLIIRTYDATVETVFKQYLSYLRTMSEVEHMPRSCLQSEWEFTARLAKRVRCAALLAPETFSEIACNQLNRILTHIDDQFTHFSEADIETNEPDYRKNLAYMLCREAQCAYASARDATLGAAQWARALAVRLAKGDGNEEVIHKIFDSLMDLRNRLVQQTEYILARSKTEDPGHDGVASRVRELLLQVFKLGFELHKEVYKFAQGPKHTPDPRARPASLQPRSTPAPRRQRPGTMILHHSVNPIMVHKELHRFVGQTSPSENHPLSPPRYRLLRSESVTEDAVDDRMFEINQFGENATQTSIEVLLSGPPAPPSRPPRPAAEGRGGQRAGRAGRAVVQFARCWMTFATERCGAGRGLRPRWASQGLEFLMLACDPCNTKYLSDEEFEELKKQMDGCISHVVGKREGRPHESPSTPDPTRRRTTKLSPLSSTSVPGGSMKEVPIPPTPPAEPDTLLDYQAHHTEAYTSRVLSTIYQLDQARDEKLRSLRAVGTVVESAAISNYEPKLRQLKFKWQRGLKIGQGTFGKVYTVVNTDSGQLLAMKELPIACGDRRALQRAANELRVLEGVTHPHLVRYYGAELHREEMLLFMELCVEGCLEALIATSGALAEPTVRKYTKQLLSAILELHTRSIVHRDIKSGNIFLTNEGHCLKLGDFGCAVKIRANTTAAGELMGHVGTQAYMAPEVFMKQSGHGRAADIWSLGCVVTEMASGKRPFSEYDSNYQIMFVVGMGGRPLVPAALSPEGRQFCLACLTHEPDNRPKARELTLHHFLLVKSDDDCKCEAGYLMS